MSTIAQIREALVDTIVNYVQDDLHGFAYMEDVKVLPALVVKPGGGGRDDRAADFTKAMARGTDVWDFQLIILCSRAHASAGQKQLDQFLDKTGDNSIRQAIWDTPALGLGDVDAMVHEVTEYGAEWKSANVENVGAAIRVRVHAF